MRQDGEPRGCQELMEFHRRAVEVRGLNTGKTRRTSRVDIGEVKRNIEHNESDLVLAVIWLGWPKEREQNRMRRKNRWG